MSSARSRTMKLVKDTAAPEARPLHSRLLSVRGLADECAEISYGQLRNWVEAADDNGLSWAICRPHGNRVFIDPERFDFWLLAKTGKPRPGMSTPLPDVDLAKSLADSLLEFVRLAQATGTEG